ncbi:MAG: polyprenyl synthetase family protein [Candidatus Saccharimonadaceae bacterium]
MKPTSVQLPSLDLARQATDGFLHEFVRTRIEMADAISPAYGDTWRAIDKLLRAGGKRLRPFMVALSYSAFTDKSDIDQIIPAMVAEELFHQAVLIHDDIIDRDTIRYGVPNMTGQYDAIYESLIDDVSERRHFSNSAALLAGDLLLSSAYQVLQRTDVSRDNLRAATETFASAIFAVSGGELLDTETAFRGVGRADAYTVALYKTAHYSFVGPLVMGAELAGASKDVIDSLRSFGEKLGTAFQLQDDLLGVYGDSAETGKSTSSDIVEGKRTHMIELFEDLADEQQRHEFSEIFHKVDASDEEIDKARALLDASGARIAVEEKIESLRAQAVGALDVVGINDDVRTAFVQLADRATKRSK